MAESSANDLALDATGYRRPLPERETAIPPQAHARFADAGLAARTILAFWAVYFLATTLRAVLIESPGQIEMLRRRALVVAIAILLSALIWLVLQAVARRGIGVKIAVAALASLPPAAGMALVNNYIFYVVAPEAAVWIDPDAVRSMAGWTMLKVIGDAAYGWFFDFAAWSAIFIAFSTARQLREADRRAALLAREAQEAQLRALRYQINPHFLFNTLNSLSALVLAKRTGTAEQMLANLSAFFRATLDADPTADVPLAEEIRLQRLYLEIEQVRFPDRLRIEIDVPEALLTHRVPVLILQPIVENSVKYGVARARRPVTIRIAAIEEAGLLSIIVRDDGDGSSASGTGTGVGLRNVCERLASRFGDAAGCDYGPAPGGGYAVFLTLPASTDD